MKRGWLALVVLMLGPPAFAQAPKVDCDLIEIAAKQGDKASIDSDLKPIEAKLSAYKFNQFTLLGKTHHSLAKQKDEPIKLKMGSASITFIEIVDKSKVRLKITLDDANGKRQVNASQFTVEAADYLVFGYPISKDKKDGHLLALTCK